MKAALLSYLLFGCLSYNLFAQKSLDDFVFKIETNESGVTNDSAYQLRLDVAGVNYNVDIDWNDDGVFDSLNVDTTIIHQYNAKGIYSIRLRGSFSSIQFGGQGGTDAEKLISIEQWGNQAWSSCHKMFQRCDNLRSLPLDTPNFTGVTDFSQMFEYCSYIGDPMYSAPMNHWDMSNATNFSKMFSRISNSVAVGSWDVSSVTDMSEMFAFSYFFNDPLNSWDVSSVTNMSAIFREAWIFDQPLNGWNVSSVRNMQRMFDGAENFDQPLNNWVVDSVMDMSHMFSGTWYFNQPINNWNVSSVTNMSHMFNDAWEFNQPLNSWNVSSVTDMSHMFRDAWDFNQPLNSWDISLVSNLSWTFASANSFDQALHHWNFSNVTNMSVFLNSTALSTSNYDSLLMHWYSNHAGLNLSVGAQFVTYCQATPQRAALISNGWSFNGDSQESNCQIVGLEALKEEKEVLTIYPNPASDRLTLSLPKYQKKILQIFNAQGQLMREIQLSAEQTSLDVSEFGNGVYFLKGLGVSEKLIVQH